MKHILIVDDHLIVRQGVEFVTRELFDDVEFHHAQTLRNMMTILSEHQIDVLILDAQFPDGISIQFIPEIRHKYPHIKILVLSSFDEGTYALQFIEAGANGFISKLSDETVLQEAIKSIVEQGFYYTPLTQQLLALKKINPQIVNPLSILSEREMEVAQLLASGLGILEIANTLDLKQNTVSTFKKRIFQKLNVDNMVDLIELIKTYKPL